MVPTLFLDRELDLQAQSDATVKEYQENKNGTNLSMTILMSPIKNGLCGFIFNIPFKDLSGISTDKNSTFFNTQTPFGVGFAIFPIRGFKVFGITIIKNFGKVNRLPTEDTDANSKDVIFFPIASHPDSGLKVGGQVPDALLNPFYNHISYYSTNIGIIFRL